MKRLALLLALALVVAACGDDDSAGTTAATAAATTTAPVETTTTAPATATTAAPEETTTTAAAGGGAHFVVGTVSFDTPMVIIYNIGDGTGSLAGHWLCQRPSYQELPDIELAPGDALAISLGGDQFVPPPGALAFESPLNLGPISASGGEIGLYSSNSFGSADAILSYVEWGNSGHGRSATAVAGGVWEDGGFVATSDGTISISLEDFDDLTPAGWAEFSG